MQGSLREGKQTCAFLLDLQKAYDTVWQDRLWVMMWDMGARWKLCCGVFINPRCAHCKNRFLYKCSIESKGARDLLTVAMVVAITSTCRFVFQRHRLLSLKAKTGSRTTWNTTRCETTSYGTFSTNLLRSSVFP